MKLPCCYGLIVAAGQSTRFGRLKQFALLKGRPLLYYSMRAFEKCPHVRSYVVVTRRSLLKRTWSLANRHNLRRLVAVVPGGTLRRHSVAAGLAVLPSTGVVAVHDGARPCLTPAMLSRGFAACARHGAALYGIPVTETLKRVTGSRVIGTTDRAAFFLAQTPQFFRLPLLRRAHDYTRPQTPAPDDSFLVERLGVRPLLLPGRRENIKVTTPEDLLFCARLL